MLLMEDQGWKNFNIYHSIKACKVYVAESVLESHI